MKLEGNFVARLKLFVGQRGASELMASLDLGITGVGYVETMEINFEPGIKIDEERVRKYMDRNIALMSEERTQKEIISYEIIEIVFVPSKEEA